MKFADLHLHTRFSDGTLTPQELVSRSKKAGLSAIAVTDHDCVLGIAPAMEAGAQEEIEVIPGIELTAEHKGIEIHMLGYLLDHRCPALTERIKILDKNRVERVHKMTAKLNELGVPLKPEDVFSIAGPGIVGRLHVARALLEKGYTSSVHEAFQKYIGDKGPAYVLGFRFSPQEAIALIKEAGGVPVLAHPYLMHDDELIPEFVACGLMGLEVYYPEHSQGMANYYLETAKKYKLLVTGGSDYHGQIKPGVKLGCIKLDYGFVEKLKEAQNRL